MKKRTMVLLAGAVTLAGCASAVGVSGSDNGVARGSYFASNAGKLVGYAEALAFQCPDIGFNEAEVVVSRVAICTSQPGVDGDCELPEMELARKKSYADTLASLAGRGQAEICEQARTEARSDFALARYLTGLQVVEVRVPAPAPVAAPEPEPEPVTAPEEEIISGHAVPQ